jgi:hypothetical protein
MLSTVDIRRHLRARPLFAASSATTSSSANAAHATAERRNAVKRCTRSSEVQQSGNIV